MCYIIHRFVANCGGILGLCMGFSIVTVFEVLHYLSQSFCGKFQKCMSKTPKYVSCCEDKELMSESPVSRQPKRGSFNASPITNTKLIVGDVGSHRHQCVRFPPNPESSLTNNSTHKDKNNCCCDDGKIF